MLPIRYFSEVAGNFMMVKPWKEDAYGTRRCGGKAMPLPWKVKTWSPEKHRADAPAWPRAHHLTPVFARSPQHSWKSGPPTAQHLGGQSVCGYGKTAKWNKGMETVHLECYLYARMRHSENVIQACLDLHRENTGWSVWLIGWSISEGTEGQV
uniref:Uncharacterized protein n=1 Tax=Molossus molossus TaxID=27622 RepID=A0A7J8HHY4_MOLMO|nr:hypothetical protein HJG59_011049 [Molossus molossus]